MQPAAGDPLLQSSSQGDGGESCPEGEHAQPSAHKSFDANLTLYADEEDKRPTTASFLSKIADLNSLPPTMDAKADFSATAKRGAELGTLTGVYLPCIQNIF